MARGRLYKSEVQAARDKLLREGTNPSLDAVRIALGNTGSKTTIHRLMKELEAEEASGAASAGEAISDALQALVTQLAGQLRQESEAILAVGQVRADAQVVAAQTEVTRLTQLAREASQQMQRLQITLDDTHQQLVATEQALHDGEALIVGLRERTTGLERQLADREVHMASIESKNQQARDALEHFRQATKEQRESDARQHEQAIQVLQVEMRRATDYRSTQNQELLALNRDNARLTEVAGQHAKEVRELRRDLQSALDDVAGHDGLIRQYGELEQRLARATVDLEVARKDHSAALTRWDGERELQAHAMRDAQMERERWGRVEAMLFKLQPQLEPKAALPDK